MSKPRNKPSPSDKPVAVYGAMAANLMIAVVKFVAAAITGSSALLAESIHSVVDTGNESLLLLGEHLAKKPADENHPFGHGQELYFWTLIVAIILFGLGGGMSIYEGIAHIRHPALIENVAASYAVIVFSALFEGSSFAIAWKELKATQGNQGLLPAIRKSKDPAIFAVLFEDGAALAGLAVAFAGILLSDRLQNPNLDGMASIVIGLILGTTAILLASKCKQLLLGTALEADQVQDIGALAQKDPAVELIRRPLTMYFGPDEVLLDLDIQFRKGLSGSEIVAAVDRLERDIRAKYPEITRIFIEAESITKGESLGSSSVLVEPTYTREP